MNRGMTNGRLGNGLLRQKLVGPIQKLDGSEDTSLHQRQVERGSQRFWLISRSRRGRELNSLHQMGPSARGEYDNKMDAYLY